MDENLFDLFQQEHPVEVQYILDHGVPAGHTFLSYLQDLCEKTYEQSYKDRTQKEYDDAMEQDLLLHTRTLLEPKIQALNLVMTKDDKRALMLKQYDKNAFDAAEEKESMVLLLTKLKTDFVPLPLYIESAQKVLAYVNKS